MRLFTFMHLWEFCPAGTESYVTRWSDSVALRDHNVLVFKCWMKHLFLKILTLEDEDTALPWNARIWSLCEAASCPRRMKSSVTPLLKPQNLGGSFLIITFQVPIRCSNIRHWWAVPLGFSTYDSTCPGRGEEVLRFFSLFFFWEEKSRFMRVLCCLCIYMCVSISSFDPIDQFSWKLVGVFILVEDMLMLYFLILYN